MPPPSGSRSPRTVTVLDNMGILHRYELVGWVQSYASGGAMHRAQL